VSNSWFCGTYTVHSSDQRTLPTQIAMSTCPAARARARFDADVHSVCAPDADVHSTCAPEFDADVHSMCAPVAHHREGLHELYARPLCSSSSKKLYPHPQSHELQVFTNSPHQPCVGNDRFLQHIVGAQPHVQPTGKGCHVVSARGRLDKTLRRTASGSSGSFFQRTLPSPPKP